MIDLERLDETSDDLSAWPEYVQERVVRDRLYGGRSGLVTPAPKECPVTDENEEPRP